MDTFEVKLDVITGDIENLLKNLFKTKNKPYDLLKQAIEREFRSNGAPEVKRMDIDRIKFDSDSSKGSFRVVLDIDYTFGCEDVLKTKENETSEWTFAIDATDNYIRFYSSPDIDSRSTADEF
ncbi:MAG: hypothetical protein V4577_17615 [Bacteroidota bacterium]